MATHVTMLTKDNFKELTEKSKKPLIIDIFATWCGPCIQMKPHFEKLADELKDSYTFLELNVDEARDIALKFNVTSVPTLIFMKNQTVVGRSTGFLPKDEIKARIEEHFKTTA